MTTKARKPGTPYSRAMKLARELVKIGIDPFRSEKERYLALLQDSPGEIIELGKPLKGTRFFDHHSTRMNIPLIEQFEDFASNGGLDQCVFWNVGVPGKKSDPAHLSEALTAFNSKINLVFSDLRKRGLLELLILVVHPRFDAPTGLIDLHAHFICRVPPEHRDDVRLVLKTKFSKTDLPDASIKNAAACITYMLTGIFDNAAMLHWPKHVLKALWGLVEQKFRFVRPAGSFAKFRASAALQSNIAERALSAARKKENRAATAHNRKRVIYSDTLLAKIRVKIRGQKIWAMLFEKAPVSTEKSGTSQTNQTAGVCSSANSFTIQEARKVQPVDKKHVHDLMTPTPIRMDPGTKKQSTSRLIGFAKDFLWLLPSRARNFLKAPLQWLNRRSNE